MAKTELKPIDITRYTITENGNVTRSKTTNEELKEQDIRLNKLCFDYQEKEKQITDLEWQLQQVIEDNDYYQKENEELQEEINEWKTKFENLQKYLDTQNCYRECAETWQKNKELQEENKKLKEELVEWNSIREDCETAFFRRDYLAMHKRVAKAKEIVKKFSEFVNNEVEYDPEHPQEHTNLWNKLCEQAEQFIKGSEVEQWQKIKDVLKLK